MKDFMFAPKEFIYNLKYMGLGLLGTFLIIGVIIGATMLFNYSANRIAKRLEEKAAEKNNEGNEQ